MRSCWINFEVFVWVKALVRIWDSFMIKIFQSPASDSLHEGIVYPNGEVLFGGGFGFARPGSVYFPRGDLGTFDPAKAQLHQEQSPPLLFLHPQLPTHLQQSFFTPCP